MPAPEAPYSDATIVVHDITADLPRHKTKRYKRVEARPIGHVVLHHTAGGTAPGLRGPMSTGRWFVHGRKWPGFAYHVFVPYAPELDSAGRLIIWQTQHFDVHSYHTGRGMNKHGLGVVCQGAFASKYYKPKPGKPRHPSEAQQLAVAHVWAWLQGLYGLPDSALTTHARHEKPACPGQWLDDWAARVRAG